MYRRQDKHKKGSALVYALIMVSIIAIIFAGLMQFIIAQLRFSLHAQPREEALQLAEAGVYFYRWYLAHETDGKTAEEVSTFWANESPYPIGVGHNDDDDDPSAAYEVDYDGSGEVGKYSIMVTKPNTGSTIAFVSVTGWTYKKPNVKRTVTVQYRRPAWSEFVILANADIEIGSTAEIKGLVHANGGIFVDGTSKMHNMVTSGAASYHYSGSTKDGVWTDGTDANVFLGGKTFPTPWKDFNSIIVAFAQIQEASDLQYNLPALPGGQGWHLIFKTDGTADVYWVKKYHLTTKAILEENQDKGPGSITLADTSAIYLRNDVWIDGVIDAGKKVSVAAHHPGNGRDHTIYINGDIVYENHTSQTILGMAAEEDIEIIKNPTVSGGLSSTALEIDAAMLAQKGRVGRSDYGNTLSEVNIYGAIATNSNFGFQGVTMRNITYDTTFLTLAPPYFPTGNVYVIGQWNEVE